MARVYISAGSNSNRQQSITMALAGLRKLFGKLALSPVYESEPVDGRGDSYYNLVIALDSNLSPAEIHRHLRQLETSLGRERGTPGRVTIDLDLLLYERLSGQFDGIHLPHPDITRYRHVLQPLADLAGPIILPGSERSIESLLNDPLLGRGKLHCIATGHQEIV